MQEKKAFKLIKLRVIKEIAEPTNIHELRRFLGMANQLAKFSENLSEETKPMRDLLSSKNEFIWGKSQTKAFDQVKKILTTPKVLAHYDLKKQTI